MISDKLYAKLKVIRDKKDITFKPPKYLKSTYIKLDGTTTPLSLRYYQVQGILHLVASTRFVLGDDCGLGKTIEAIAALCCLFQINPDQKAVVLTTKSAVQQWADEFEKFTSGITVIVSKGTKAQREKALKRYTQMSGPVVIIMGYRSAVQDFSILQDFTDEVLITDESSAYKTPKTQVHKVCKYLSKNASRSWGLTATLIKNHLMEGFGIYEVIYPGFFDMSYNKFMMYYCITKDIKLKNGRKIPTIIGYHKSRVQEFRDFIDPVFLGRPKHAVSTELPVLTTKVQKVVLTDKQLEKYAEALEGLLAVGSGAEKETDKLTALIYCQQIVNDLGLLEFENEESPKLQALLDLLTEDFADEKVIVFSRFRKMIDIIMPALKAKKIKAVRLTGSEDDKAREKAKKAFQDPESDTQVICITTAGSDAINLQAAKALICYDTPWSAGEFIQLAGRMLRIGSIHDQCFAIHLVAEGPRNKKTIDSRVLDVLQKKMDLVESVLGKRLNGGEETVDTTNDITDIFRSLLKDAKE